MVWAELIDWEGQRRWIPFTTVRVDDATTRVGLGVRAEALSGFWLGPAAGRPAGPLRGHRLDARRTGADGRELEILHPGPYFTGPGVFRLEPARRRWHDDPLHRAFDLPGGGSPSAGSARAAGDAGRLPAAACPARWPSPPMLLRELSAPGRPRRTRSRCPWALSTPEYIAYHDDEWGRPVRTVEGLYERLTLEAFQSGLSPG